MLSPKAIAVLVAMRDLAREKAAATPMEKIGRTSCAPTPTQLATRAGVSTGELPGLRDDLLIEGLVTTSCGATVVTILGHDRIAERERAAAAPVEVAA